MPLKLLKSKAYVCQNRFTDFLYVYGHSLSEHFLGVWGLIIGIPLFMFMLDILGVTSSEDPAKKSVKVHTENKWNSSETKESSTYMMIPI